MQRSVVSYSRASQQFLQENRLADSDSQELIEFCVRVSRPRNTIDSESSERLIKYLNKHRHWSPLEMVNDNLAIETTRDIAHQIVRHRSFSFQEFSQRYANPEDMGDVFVYSEARLQDTKNRQNSIETENVGLHHDWFNMQKEVAMHALEVYNMPLIQP